MTSTKKDKLIALPEIIDEVFAKSALDKRLAAVWKSGLDYKSRYDTYQVARDAIALAERVAAPVDVEALTIAVRAAVFDVCLGGIPQEPWPLQDAAEKVIREYFRERGQTVQEP